MTIKSYLKCTDCGHEEHRTDNIYTGLSYEDNFDFICGECRGTMYRIKAYEPGHHLTECEKVLAYYDIGG
jgi:Zn finger protein HypA/HybF involved in hydrogenase expression